MCIRDRSYGGTGSGATFINPTYFVAGTGILNVSSSSCSTGSWLGSASVDWFNGANWCGGVVPTATDNVTILAGTPFAPTISAAAVCNNCLLYTSDAADERSSVDLGGR